MRTAAIGIGSNSLRMLIADISDGKLKRLRRYREGLRVFAALDESGNITRDMIRKAADSVAAFRKEALSQGAQHVHLYATSAVRDAANQEAFAKTLLDATGLVLEICSGDEEARLSYVGAADGAHAGMIDIGGGSTEIAVGSYGRVEQAVSLQMGAVRLCRIRPIATVSDAWDVVRMADEILTPQKQRFLSQNAERWFGAGGTFTALASLVQRVPWERRENIHGFMLTKASVQEAMEHLAVIPLADRVKRPYIQPNRAEIVVHGIAILLACMQGLHISQIAVSEYGNLEGYLKLRYLSSEEY